MADEVGRIFEDAERGANAGFDAASGSLKDVNDAIAERMGQDIDKAPVKVSEDGKIEVDGNKVESVEEFKAELAKLSPEVQAQLESALKNPDLGNVTNEVKDNAVEQGKANNQSGLLQDAIKEDGSGFGDMMKKLMNSSAPMMGKLLKYTVVGALTYTALTAIASAQTGCYAVYNNTNFLVKKKADDMTDTMCVGWVKKSGNNDAGFKYTTFPYCNDGCQNFIPGCITAGSADIERLTEGHAPNTSCNCLTGVGGDLENPNVSLTFTTKTAWDVFGDIVNGVGGFITKIGDDLLKIVDAASDVLSDLPKILMYGGIGIAVIGVIIGVVFLVKKLKANKTAKGLKAGYWDKKKEFKHWKRSMKQIQRITPYSHLSMSQAVFR